MSGAAGKGGLAASRERIAELDREILRLVGVRMEVARQIGEIKRGQGKPLRDWETEKRVLDRAERAAGEVGLDPELARSLLGTIIGGSRVEQERLSYSEYRGQVEDVLIVGGLGRRGQWFGRFLQDQGHGVSVYDPGRGETRFPRAGSLEEGLARSGVTLLASPLDTIADLLRRIAETGYEGVVFDIASLKSHLAAAIVDARSRGLSVTSLHPMFGPATRSLSDKVICVCDCGDAVATQRVLGFVRETAATIVSLSLEEHDRVISSVLGLSHLINVLFASVLSESGMDHKFLRRVGSTTFHSQMATTETVVRENPELYYAIQRFNPNRDELYRCLQRTAEEITRSVQVGDFAAFARVMARAASWVDGGRTGSEGAGVGAEGKGTGRDRGIPTDEAHAAGAGVAAEERIGETSNVEATP